jgi:predicted permease
MLSSFRRGRGFFAVAVGLLAVGIGSAMLVFGLADELLLEPLPVRDPGNLYLLERTEPDMLRPLPYFPLRVWRDAVLPSPVIAAAVAETPPEPQYLVPLREGANTRLVMAQIVSPNYFQELALRPAAGRLLDAADAAATGALPAVLSWQFWRSQFGGEASAIGRSIRLKDQSFVIVGVLPREFHSIDIDRAPDVRLPMPAAEPLFGRIGGGMWFEILARLRPGVTPETAQRVMLPALQTAEYADSLERNAKQKTGVAPEILQRSALSWRPVWLPVKNGVSRVRQQFGDALRLLLGGVGLLLLAVCANVAGLLIARAGERRKEFGIRVAVGASRWRIVRQLLGESLLLAVPGAALGGFLAWALAPTITGLLPPVRDLANYASPQLLQFRLDWRVLGFGLVLSLLAALASAIVPAWRASRVDLSVELKAGLRARTGVWGLAPVALQAAFCTLLLAAAGLMLRSWWNLDHLDAGFDREHVIEFTVDPGSAGYGMQQSGTVFAEMRRRVRELPGVRSAAWAWRGVMRGSGIKTTVAPQGVVLPKGTRLNTSVNDVSPGYFETLGLRLLSGRDLQSGDGAAKPMRVVVNQALVDQFFPNRDAIGKVLVAPERTIVGVVSTAKYRSMREPDAPTIYGVFDEAKGSDWQVVLYVRTHGAPAALAGAVRDTLRAVDPAVPLVEAHTLDEEIRASLWQERLVAILSAFFGITAVLLAAIGLYGALSLSVAQRRRELGIRVAIGARLGHVLRTVCSPMAAGVACGVAAGIAASVALLRVTRALLYGVEPFDGVSLAAAVAVVAACSVAAAAVPARRAARVDPARALRDE